MNGSVLYTIYVRCYTANINLISHNIKVLFCTTNTKILRRYNTLCIILPSEQLQNDRSRGTYILYTLNAIRIRDIIIIIIIIIYTVDDFFFCVLIHRCGRVKRIILCCYYYYYYCDIYNIDLKTCSMAVQHIIGNLYIIAVIATRKTRIMSFL